MPLIIVAIGVALLLLLMLRFKVNGFLSLILVALAVGLMEGMPIAKVMASVKAGVGGTLGSLALVLAFGAMLGKLMADCGGAQRIATTLIAWFGVKRIQWAVVITGFVVGFALFYEVGFVLMIPLVFTIAASARMQLLAHVAHNLRQAALNVHVHVFQFALPNKGSGLYLFPHLRKAPAQGFGLFNRQHALSGQHARVSLGTGDILPV